MRTQAYFQNIQQHIIQQIKAAKQSILVAVAWLTDAVIFRELCNKAEGGKLVELLLVQDSINNGMAPFDHMRLEQCGGRVYFLPPQADGAIMHHKFCIIDGCTVITGSYNWSKKAQLNDENIVITEDASELGAQFIKEFEGHL
jgi:phosphatidylserine/phosphatidylglycerophosphate/cardiolipin synthase-like enzyme